MSRKPKKDATGSPLPKRDYRSRFLDPGPSPKFDAEPRDELERARLTNELYDWYMQRLIHSAVRTNDPDARQRLASLVNVMLLQDMPIRRPIREWLSFTLMRLSEGDQLPHLARGNAVKVHEHNAFMQRLAKVMQELPPGTVTGRLDQAANALGASVSKVKAAYYDEWFPMWEAQARQPGSLCCLLTTQP